MKYNRHQLILKTAFISIYGFLDEHRSGCDKWSYDGRLKMVLTNSKKAIKKCFDSIEIDIEKKDIKQFMRRMEGYQLFDISTKDSLVVADYKKELPNKFLCEVSRIQKTVEYIENKLTPTVNRCCRKEYDHFMKWYMHFYKFLMKDIFDHKVVQ